MWEEKLKIYDQLIDGIPEFERKGKTMPYTSSNGYMFSMLNKAGEIGIRLPKNSKEKFEEEHKTGPFKSYGAVIREYVLIPQELLSNTQLIRSLLIKGFDYVNSLEPK